MKRKISIIGIIGLLMLLSVGRISTAVQSTAQSAAQFFGIRVLDPNEATEVFTNVRRTESGRVTLSITEGKVDTTIYCWGDARERYIYFYIHNKSQNPIDMNYTMDNYVLIAHDESSYKLPTSMWQYPQVINPKERKEIVVELPDGIWLEDIKYLAVALNYGRVFIFLRKIEEQQKEPDIQTQIERLERERAELQARIDGIDQQLQRLREELSKQPAEGEKEVENVLGAILGTWLILKALQGK